MKPSFVLKFFFNLAHPWPKRKGWPKLNSGLDTSISEPDIRAAHIKYGPLYPCSPSGKHELYVITTTRDLGEWKTTKNMMW